MKNIWNGYYMRYDGKLVCVVGTLERVDTGEQLVLCKYNAPKQQHFYAIGKESFLSRIEIGGKEVPCYRRLSVSRALSEEEAQRMFEKSGAFPPAQAVKEKRSSLHTPSATYAAYAKDLCESYLRDLRLSRAEGADEEARAAAENVRFLDGCMQGPLREYGGYFRERFVEGKSVRKYADAHGINRGSVDYLQKKFFAALAKCLAERDAAEGVYRLVEL